MNKRTADFASLVLIAVAAGLAAWFYPALPDPMPTHWNAAGEVDGWMPKPWGVIILPGAAALVFVVMKLIPVISPKGFRTDEFAGVLAIFQLVLVAFMTLVTALVLLEALGVDAHLETVMMVATGLLLVVLGNYMTKVRKNFFLGIRTPWTLASDEVWARTHRLGGRLFMLCGLILVVGVFVAPGRLDYVVGLILAIAIVPIVYSYVAYRRIEGFTEDAGNDAG